ncbi:9259_t:CDS:2 [Entrophospora sp. SA101]|nr:9259_t:CDS:2 [Entrophospora sp. SA101]CAJ0907018.1 12322_t:CDS:2 [Entrophospora sp. SA101]
MENKCSTEENLKTLNLLILIIKTDNIFDDEASDSNIHLVVEVPVPAATSNGGNGVTDTYVNSSTPSATSAGIIPSKPSFPPPTTSSSGYLLPSYRIYGFIVTIVLMFLL